MNSTLENLYLGIIATLIGLPIAIFYFNKAQKTSRKNMLWAYRLVVALKAIGLAIFGIYEIVSSLYEIFK